MRRGQLRVIQSTRSALVGGQEMRRPQTWMSHLIGGQIALDGPVQMSDGGFKLNYSLLALPMDERDRAAGAMGQHWIVHYCNGILVPVFCCIRVDGFLRHLFRHQIQGESHQHLQSRPRRPSHQRHGGSKLREGHLQKSHQRAPPSMARNNDPSTGFKIQAHT